LPDQHLLGEQRQVLLWTTACFPFSWLMLDSIRNLNWGSCSMQQGMLQLAKDFYTNFHQSCQRCELVTLLQEGTS
tara:strand:- start:1429 stop:1653 length:225 start_codon:yes stop_codon:yes gene_type:complete